MESNRKPNTRLASEEESWHTIRDQGSTWQYTVVPNSTQDSETGRWRQRTNGEFTASQSRTAAGGMGPKGGGLPEQRAAGRSVVRGTWDRGIHLFCLAEEGVPGLEGSSGDNLTQAKLQKGTSGIYLQSSATYSSDGNHTSTVNDVNNITTTYTYDGLGRVTGRTSPTETGNITVAQTYVSGSDRINSNYVSGQLSIANTYEDGNLTATSRKTFEASIPQWQRYNMPVDAWGNMTAVQVQSGDHVDSGDDVTWNSPITFASYEYAPNGGPITSLEYGNGDSEAYGYNLYGQLSSIQHYSENLLEYVESYAYDPFGNVGRSVVTDGSGSLIADYQYEYDSLGRLIRSQQSGDGVTELWTQHEYDDQNRLSDQYWRVSDSSLHESYNYNNNNGTLSSMLLGTGRTLSFEYDNLLRVSRRNVSGVYQHRRNYIGTGIANRQSNRIQYFVYASADGADTKLNYRYDYDAAGNISEVYRSVGSDTLAFYNSYEYDKLGQLTKATDSRGTETYTYNTAGNLLSRTLAGDTVTYSYDNAQWNDLLTTYDGQKIAYEGQTYNSSRNSVSGTVISGNPVSYYNGTRWSMEWSNGRQLMEASSNKADVTYTYDRNGLRTTKTVDGVTYHYAYAGDKLVWQEWDGNEFFFFYDNEGAPVGFWYHPASGSNVTGYYMTTQQGDITRIEDVNGNVLATYEYDAWGKLISSSGSLATINPLRYRGYYYDTETELYYLSSRYYDPKVSRFINADSTDAVLSANGLYDQNLFAYCDNNPVMRTDMGGEIWNLIVGGAIGGFIGAVTSMSENIAEGKQISLLDTASGFVFGAIGGALAASIPSMTVSVLGNAALSMLENGAGQIIEKRDFMKIDIADMLFDGVIGGIAGAIGGQGAGISKNHLKSLNKQVMSRVKPVYKNKGIKAGIAEAKKAFTYYRKNTTKYYDNLYKGTRLDTVVSITSSILTSDRMKGRYRTAIRQYER